MNYTDSISNFNFKRSIVKFTDFPSKIEFEDVKMKIETGDVTELQYEKFDVMDSMDWPEYFNIIPPNLKNLSVHIPKFIEVKDMTFFEILKDNSSLEALKITLWFKEKEQKLIQKMINFNRNLKTLTLEFSTEHFKDYTILCNGITENRSLTELNLMMGQVKDLKFLSYLPNLKILQLNLAGNYNVQDVIDYCTELESLNLNLGENISNFDGSKSKIKSIELGGSLNFEGLNNLFRGLNTFPLLTSLNTNRLLPSFQEEEIDGLDKLFKKNLLKKLDVYLLWGKQSFFFKSLNNCHSLEEFSLYFLQQFKDDDHKDYGSAIRSKKNLKNLTVQNCSLSKKPELFFNQLYDLNLIKVKFTYLNFDNNLLESLVKLIKNNLNLQLIELLNVDFKIKDQEILKSITDEIISHPNLKHFTMTYNYHNVSSKEIINLIQKSQLESLYISTIKFEEKEFQDFKDSLIENRFLKFIKFDKLFMSPEKDDTFKVGKLFISISEIKKNKIQEMMKNILLYNHHLIFYIFDKEENVCERNLVLSKMDLHFYLKIKMSNDIQFYHK